MEKVIVASDLVSVSAKELGGVISLIAAVKGGVGGGELAGALKVTATAQIDLSLIQLIDVVAMVTEEKYPSIAPLIELLHKQLDLLAAAN